MHAVVWTDFFQTLALVVVLGALYWKGIAGLRQQGSLFGLTDALQLNWGLPDVLEHADWLPHCLQVDLPQPRLCKP